VEFYAEEGKISIQIETIKTKCINGEAKMHHAVAINYARSIAHLAG